MELGHKGTTSRAARDPITTAGRTSCSNLLPCCHLAALDGTGSFTRGWGNRQPKISPQEVIANSTENSLPLFWYSAPRCVDYRA
ncbi:hypothetical protein QC762_0042420 [Podospora pseudocomata]|uniref:Uncharacterized protein n=1 Tax=Podospora pseudocomata TaxID=2093779 RepID=A0ABR0GMX1_9PEZI|nr:hypothetical protein QC762_0042420 [Podospora pseudocomata]